MSKLIVAGIAAAGLLGSALASVEVAANPKGGSPAAANGQIVRHHHRNNRFYPYAPYYYYGYDQGYVVDEAPAAAPPPKPTAEKPAETKRGCDPQTYTVPKADGGESQVTVLRC